MIDVIKHGYTRYYATCFKCHCQFAYQLEDIDDANGQVYCPDCGYGHIHSDLTDYDLTSQIKE